MKVSLLEALLSARRALRPVAVVSRLDSQVEEQRLMFGAEADPLAQVVQDALRYDRSVVHELGAARWFIRPYNPPLRMFVVGAVHVTQALAPMAKALGYAVTVIDPRGAFAREERFQGVARSEAWPDEALESAALDGRSAVVVLTHDPKLDDPALGVALRSPAFYVGALGSRKTHAKRVARLTEQGLTAPQIERIFAPVGLNIGAKTPAEIAASIIAQVTAVLRGSAP